MHTIDKSKRKVRTFHCKFCKDDFKSQATHSDYCKKPECQKEKKRLQMVSYREIHNAKYRKYRPNDKSKKPVRHCQFRMTQFDKTCGRVLDPKKSYFLCEIHQPAATYIGL